MSKSQQIDFSKKPEGATHAGTMARAYAHQCWYKQMPGGGWRYSYDYGERWDIVCGEPCHTPLIPVPAEWVGEGLPPVGIACEIGCAETWDECFIIAHHKHAGVERAVYTYFLHGAGIEVNWCIAAGFRPIRTPEQIAAEERDKAVEGMIADTNILTGIMRDRRIMAGQLYDAGYRKQVAP